MRPYLRAILYAACLVGLLAGATYVVYWTPSQVEARVARLLARIARVPIRAEGCRGAARGRLEVEALECPSSPRFDAAVAARLYGLRTNDPGSEAPLEGADPAFASRRFTARVRRADLDLERGREAGSADSWNVERILRTGIFWEDWKASRPQVAVEEVSASVRDLRPGSPRTRISLEARDLLVRPSTTGALEFAARVWPGSSGSWGALRGEVFPDGAVRLRGELAGFRDVSGLIDLLSDPGSPAPWRMFEAVEPADLRIEELVFEAGGGSRLSAEIRHYDSTLRLGSAGLAIGRASGTARLAGGVLKLGSSGEDGLRGELWGAPALVSGEVGAGGGRIVVRVPPVRLEEVRAAGSARSAGLVPRVLEALEASGALSGALRVSIRAAAPEDWEGEFRFEEAALGLVPFVQRIDGAIRVDRSLGPEGSSARGGEGRGKIAVERILALGLAPAWGEVSFSWSEDELRFKAYLEAGGAREEPPKDGVAAKDSLGHGSVFGTIGWNLRSGALDAALRCMGVSISTPLARVRDASGDLELAGDSARLALNLSGIAIPAGALWEGQEELAFEGGRCSLRLGGGRIAVDSFRILGTGRCLRARGEVEARGGADLVVFFVEGPEHVSVNALDDTSAPAAWRAAARGAFRTFRVTGSLLAPRVRELSPQDGVFFAPR